ncbi:methylmalonyl-CoA epimerase [bacterium]|nr:methylmalonyl-CoA epimerase [bacterium]
MIQKIDHIGIAVRSLDEGIKLYRDTLGMKLHAVEEVTEQKVRVAMFDVAGVHIELLEPTSEDSPIAKFLEKQGPGMHHICYEVDDVDESLNEFQEKGIRAIDKSSRPGAAGKRVGFLHPKSTASVLIELNSSEK